MNIFVGSLSFKTTEEELQKEFEAFGEVQSVKIILDHETLKSRGFGFVTMPNQDQATAAIAALNGREINGFAMKVNESKPRDSSRPASRGPGGPGYSSNRSGSGFSGPSGGYNRSRTANIPDSRDLDIYDTKGGPGGGGYGKKGRGGSGRNSNGRPGGGRRSY